MRDGGYRLWECGKERFGVTRAQEVLPLLGYVSRRTGKVWTIERAGKILEPSFVSAAAAAQVLIELANTRPQTTQRRERP
jgi:hypothetical protein